MHTRVRAEITADALASPNEICGFIYSDGSPKLYPCTNIATDPTEEFEISNEDHIAAMSKGELLGVYHSHPDNTSFSPADLECADELGLPFYLCTPQQWREYIPPTYQLKLEGMRFALGFNDCYGLVRHYYRQHFKHYLSDYDRDESFCHEEQGVIMQSFEKEGLVIASQPQINDILLFKTDKAVPQHFGILVGPQRMLHHFQGGLSGVETLTDRWLSRLVCTFSLKQPSK